MPLTISSNEPREEYAIGSTPTTGPHIITWEFFALTDIRCFVDGEELTYAVSSPGAGEFTVSGTPADAGGYTGGTVTTGDSLSNATLVLLGDVPIERTTNFQLSGPFPIPTLNLQLNKIFAILKQILVTAKQAIALPVGEAGPIEIPSIAERAGKWLGFDPSGNIIVQTLADIGVVVVPREKLETNRTYYVRGDGNNANTGLANTAGGAWRNIQYAVDFIGQRLDLNGYSVVVQVGDGTYNESILLPGYTGESGRGYDQITIAGNPANNTGVVLAGDGVQPYTIFAGVHSLPWTFKNMTLQCATGDAVEADAGGVIALQNVRFGATSGRHVFSVHQGSRVNFITTGYDIAGNASFHWLAQAGGAIFIQPGKVVTLIGTPSFSVGSFVGAINGGRCIFGNTLWSGSATGPKWTKDQSGVIQHDADLDVLPGTFTGYEISTPQKSMVNPVGNGDFQVWQNGTSVAASASGIVYGPSRWFFYRNALATGATVSRQAGGEAGIAQCARIQRDSGNASTANLFFVQTLRTQDSLFFAGKKVTLSVKARKGADFSPTATCALALVTGKGTDQTMFSGFTSAADALVVDLRGVDASGFKVYSQTVDLPGDITQLGLRLTYAPVGTAGAADYIDIAHVRIDVGPFALELVPEPYEQALARVEAFEQVFGGDDADEYFASGNEISGGATARFFLPFKRTMRGVPVLTTAGAFEAYSAQDGSVADVSSLALLDPSRSRSALSCSVTHTAGRGLLLKAKNDTTARLTLRAELG